MIDLGRALFGPRSLRGSVGGESKDRDRAARIVRLSDRERSKGDENDDRDDDESCCPGQTAGQHAHRFEVERGSVHRGHDVRAPLFLTVRALSRIVV